MLRKSTSRRPRPRRGSVVVWTAVCLTVLLGFTAIALDGGRLLQERRHAQAAADATALAAANDLAAHYAQNAGLDPSGTARTSALTVAALNGYDNDGVTNTVTVQLSPASYQLGPHAGQLIPPGYAEVIVQYDLRRSFSAIFGSGPIPVAATATARVAIAAIGNGIILLAPHGKGTLTDTGNGNVTVVNAPLVIDSDDPAAGVATGNGSVTAPTLYITGYPGTSSSGHGAFNGQITHGPPVPDPLADLRPPDSNTLPVQSESTLQITGKADVTLNPGVYKGGIKISGQGNVTLNPGIYYFDGGGFSTSGQGNLIGHGVMLYNAPVNSSDGISITGNGSVDVTPPASGPYQGISLFQERNSPAPLQVTGNGDFTMTGTFYAAKAELRVTGNGSNDVIGSQYITYTLKATGNGSFNVIWTPQTVAHTATIDLVE